MQCKFFMGFGYSGELISHETAATVRPGGGGGAEPVFNEQFHIAAGPRNILSSFTFIAAG